MANFTSESSTPLMLLDIFRDASASQTPEIIPTTATTTRSTMPDIMKTIGDIQFRFQNKIYQLKKLIHSPVIQNYPEIPKNVFFKFEESFKVQVAGFSSKLRSSNGSSSWRKIFTKNF